MSSVFESKKTTSLTRRIAAGVVMLVGVIFLISTFANNLFAVGPDFEEMIDDFRPMLAEESIATAQEDLAMLDAVGTEFETAIVPALSAQLGMTNDEFMAFTAANYPDVANGVEALPVIVPTFNGLVDTLDSQRDLFESADAIPTESLPATTVPWGLFASGIGLLVTGFLMFRPGRLGIMLTGGLAVLMVVSTLGMSLIPKAADADELNENLRPIYTPELIAQANGALATVGAMGVQMQTEMLPDLAQQLGMSADELNQFLGANFPATAQALGELPEAMGRFQTLTSTFENNLDNYETIEPVAFSPIIWTMFIGALVALAAAVAAWWFNRKDATSDPVHRIADLDLQSPNGERATSEATPAVRAPEHV